MTKSTPLNLDLRACLFAFLMLGLLMAGCTPKEPPMPTELILYNWVEYMPQSVMDAFTKEYGITIKYVAYETEEDVPKNIQAGNVYDLVLTNPEFIPQMIEEGLLKPIDYQQIPNFKNVSANFRDLVFDPGNKYSIPFHWGTTGILVRTDLIDRPITSWNDLWDPVFAGKVGIWAMPQASTQISLKALGYSINTDDPAELEKAGQYLLQLKPNAVLVSGLETSMVPMLESGQVEIGFGWAYDAALGKEANVQIEYVIPEEGTILWMDSFVVPANANNPRGAELFLNFILQPEIAAQIINESYYPMAVDGTEQFVLPEILHDPVIFPDTAQIQNGEFTLPIRPERKLFYDRIWADFMEDTP
jgi:spermidine/putrescine transport system substrate-binding protein